MGVEENVKAESIKHVEDIRGEYVCLLSRERIFKLYNKAKAIKKNTNNFNCIKIRTFKKKKKFKDFLLFKETRNVLFPGDTVE